MTTKNKSVTQKAMIFAGLLAILSVSIVGSHSAYGGKAAYMAGQATSNITQLEGDVYVYKYLLGNLGEYQNSIIYASESQSGFTVGVGYYAIGDGTFPDTAYELSYLDNGATYNNKHYFGSTLNEGWMDIEVKKDGSNWKTYHNGGLHKTLACTTSGCPSNFKLFGAATNTNSALSNIQFEGDFQNLKGKKGGSLLNWSSLKNDEKCEASSGAYASDTNFNTMDHYESSPGGTGSCSTVSWGWFYNGGSGSWGT
ncbi:hypothetical protein SCCGRSA3_02061 [Marine Group I thaumarchaeote SCGC RSA3]|uniref:Uncharacterized protein n=3 Tax=Marine Group I TaxID=905826 RepID=A0A081RL23_9ARCH|nr:hypothetical protein AAA799N04_01691 [Marine Group I thaumarchaeote SCGC AAA799-N04]KFM15630.1 hypothetical protein AAA799D11_01149 [Marine Group I thaumarchaeote SCGC AAA799-D11]KFM16744.1 hypothetical protein SCCGRSA3_02061 [Marine Group I thaumarchaeote SCGC RSA3]